MLVVQTFRTPNEAVELANNTRFGLAACVWSESIGLALEVAPRLKAGVVWINTANQFDAAVWLRRLPRIGLMAARVDAKALREYLKLRAVPTAKVAKPANKTTSGHQDPEDHPPRGAVITADPNAIDRTAKLYIGGKQARPDGGYSREVWAGSPGKGRLLGLVPEGNRKDIRNAVEAARAAAGLGEGPDCARPRPGAVLPGREPRRRVRERFVAGDGAASSAKKPRQQRKCSRAIECLFTYRRAGPTSTTALVHQPPVRSGGAGDARSRSARIGTDGAGSSSPSLGLDRADRPGHRDGQPCGRRAVCAMQPLIAAELYQVFDTSDLPGGVVNLVTGDPDTLADVLAAHADVDAFWWPSADAAQAKRVEALSVSNLKRLWVGDAQIDMRRSLEQAVQVKNVWVPYGV